MNNRAPKRLLAISAILLAAVTLALAAPGEAQNHKFPSVISDFAPSIPTIAFTARLGGKVVINVVLGGDGMPTSAHAIEGHPLLQEPTENAALRWRFDSSREGARTVRLVFVYPQLTFGKLVSIIVLPYQTELKVQAPLYVKLPEIESHIPAGWEQGDRCTVHHGILKKDKVEIRYGLMAFKAGYREAEVVSFPNANVVFYGGCVKMMDPASGRVSPRFAEVLFCPKCRVEAKRWSKANLKNRLFI